MTWSIQDKNVLITGATSGIGRAAALAIAERGANLVILGRDQSKLVELEAELRERAPAATVTTHRADLSDPTQVRAAAGEILDAHDRIDVLANNAGVAARSPRTAPSGHDFMIATNYLGPFLLTHLLIDRLAASAPSRVVFTASEAHRFSRGLDPETFDQIGGYTSFAASENAYGSSKFLDLLAADELGRRLDSRGISVRSFCPGVVSTGLVREVPGAQALARAASHTPFIRTPEQGARMLVHLVCDDDLEPGVDRFHSSTAGLRRLPQRRLRGDRQAVARIYHRTCDIVDVEPLAAS